MAFVWKSEFQVSGNNGGSGGAPKVAVNHLGQAIVAWQDGSSVKGHAIDAFGNPTGADFTVASLNTTATLDIDIAPLANGDFVVVHEFQFSATDMDVRYARFRLPGYPLIRRCGGRGRGPGIRPAGGPGEHLGQRERLRRGLCPVGRGARKRHHHAPDDWRG